MPDISSTRHPITSVPLRSLETDAQERIHRSVSLDHHKLLNTPLVLYVDPSPG